MVVLECKRTERLEENGEEGYRTHFASWLECHAEEVSIKCWEFHECYGSTTVAQMKG